MPAQASNLPSPSHRGPKIRWDRLSPSASEVRATPTLDLPTAAPAQDLERLEQLARGADLVNAALAEITGAASPVVCRLLREAHRRLVAAA